MADILAIVGSVKFACPDGLHIVTHVIVHEFKVRRPDRFTSGGADGTDLQAEGLADELGIPKSIHLPKNRRWAPEGVKARNILVAAECTRLLAIRCAESKTFGSGYTRDLAAKRGKPTRTVTIHRDGRVDDTGWPEPEPQLPI
jgi:hypothetical protein